MDRIRIRSTLSWYLSLVPDKYLILFSSGISTVNEDPLALLRIQATHQLREDFYLPSIHLVERKR